MWRGVRPSRLTKILQDQVVGFDLVVNLFQGQGRRGYQIKFWTATMKTRRLALKWRSNLISPTHKALSRMFPTQPQR